MTLRFSSPRPHPVISISKKGSLQRADLKHGRAGSDSLVRDGGVATSQDDVGLAADRGTAIWCHWHSEGETSVNSGGRGEDWAGDSDESTVDLGARDGGGND